MHGSMRFSMQEKAEGRRRSGDFAADFPDEAEDLDGEAGYFGPCVEFGRVDGGIPADEGHAVFGFFDLFDGGFFAVHEDDGDTS